MINDQESISKEIRRDYCEICLMRFKNENKSQHEKNSLSKFSLSEKEYIHICDDCWKAIRITGKFREDKRARFNDTIPIDSILKKRGKLKSRDLLDELKPIEE